MKIDYSTQLPNYQLAYAITGNTKYCISIDTWNTAKEVVNIRSGLVIGYISQGIFTRAWGFRKDLGKSGLVNKSLKNK